MSEANPLSVDAAPWRPPRTDGNSPWVVNGTMPAPSEIAQLRATAHEQGYADGHAAGIADAAAEIQVQREQFETLLSNATHALTGLDTSVIDAIDTLIRQGVTAVLAREVDLDDGLLKHAIDEALELLQDSSAPLTLYVSPRDAELIPTLLEGSPRQQRCRVEVDHDIAIGGVRLETADCHIDATLDHRLRTVLRQALDPRES